MSVKHLMRNIRYWLVVNLIFEFATSREGVLTSIHVNYKQFVLAPAMTFERCGNTFDMNFDELAHVLDTEADFHVSHTIVTNRLRMKGRLKLNPDFACKEDLYERKNIVFLV